MRLIPSLNPRTFGPPWLLQRLSDGQNVNLVTSGMSLRTAKNILIAGRPRCGKSTLIERIIGRIEKPTTGFFTREIREKGRRVGFSICTLDGKQGFLAHQKISSPLRVGKYGVDLLDLERIAVPSMIPSQPDAVVIIDEVGKMECLSTLFCDTLIRALGSENPVIASISEKGGPFIQDIKGRHDVSLLRLTETNRDHLADLLQEEWYFFSSFTSTRIS